MGFEQTDAKAATQPAASNGFSITDIDAFTPPTARATPDTAATATAETTQVADATQVAQAAPKPSKGTVYLDVGHCTSSDKDPFTGKRDQGFVTPEYTECKLNTEVGKMVARDLVTNGFQVIPTWNPFKPPGPGVPKPQDLQNRVDVVNNDVAKYCDDSIYVSIHHDQDPTKEGGQCTYVADPKMSEATPLARTIQNNAWQVRNRQNNPLCISSDKVTGNGQLVGLRGVNTHAVLIEAANAMNPGDRARLSDSAHLRREANGIVRGITEYFKLRAGKDRPMPACKRGLG